MVDNGVSKDFSFSTTIGDVSIEGISPENINVDTSSGDVEIGILESIMNYETNLSSSSGNVISYSLEKTPPQILFNKKHMVDVETITGDIKVLFKGRKKSC